MASCAFGSDFHRTDRFERGRGDSAALAPVSTGGVTLICVGLCWPRLRNLPASLQNLFASPGDSNSCASRGIAGNSGRSGGLGRPRTGASDLPQAGRHRATRPLGSRPRHGASPNREESKVQIAGTLRPPQHDEWRRMAQRRMAATRADRRVPAQDDFRKASRSSLS